MPRKIISSFVPSSLSGLLAWFKADALALNDGDAISTWADSSGNGNNATQGTGAAQPTFKKNIINGLPVARFSGSNDMAVANQANFNVATFTMFVVAVNSGGTSGNVFSKNTLVANNTRRHLQIQLTSSAFNYNSGNDGSDISESAPTSSFNIYGVTARSDTDHDLILNGATANFTTSLPDESFNTATPQIGAAFNNGAERLTGDIAEIVIYNRSLSAAESLQVQNYLAGKYGLINNTLPGSYNLTRTASGQRQIIKDFKTCLSLSGAASTNVSNSTTPGSKVFTMAMWVNPSFSNTHQDLMTQQALFAIDWEIKASGLMGLNALAEISIATSTKAVPTGSWHHIAVTYDALGNYAFYLDGLNAGSGTNLVSSLDITHTFVIGQQAGFGLNFQGLMDNVGFWTVVLSPTDIANLYNGVSVPQLASCKFFYKFDEGSGTTATDSSGNGNNGTLNGAGATYSTNVVMKPRTVAT